MSGGFDRLVSLRDDAFDYARMRWASLRLDAVDKLSSGLSVVFAWMIIILLALLALTLMMVALALWTGEMLGNLSLGFLIAGGGFLLLGAIMLLLGRALFANALVKYFVNLFFTDGEE